MDYLFSFVLIAGFFGILFAFSMTLSVAEISQYITYSAARSYMAAHESKEKQVDLAQRKFDSLTKNPIVRRLFESGWFSIESPDIGHISQKKFPDSIPADSANRDLFWGVGSEFQAHVLDFRIPFYGSTTKQNNKKGKSGFRTFISSYLGREPTREECMNFNSFRCNGMKALGYGGSFNPSSNHCVLEADNGC